MAKILIIDDEQSIRSTLAQVLGDEVGRLIDSFNAMSTQIAETNRRLDNERAYLFAVLDSVSAGIIAFSDSFELLSINRAAVQMLQIESPVPRARLTDVLMGDLTPLFDTIRELTLRAARSREVTLIRGGELLYLEVSASRLSGGSESGWVVAMEDSTQLVQAQKLAAWNEAARRIAWSSRSPIPAAVSPTPTRTSSFFRTFPPKAAAPASAWPSSTAS